MEMKFEDGFWNRINPLSKLCFYIGGYFFELGTLMAGGTAVIRQESHKEDEKI